MTLDVCDLPAPGRVSLPLAARWKAIGGRRGRAAILLSFLVAPGVGAAQDNGMIRGTVTDATGAVVAGAHAAVRSEALIGGSRSMATNASGVFRFPALPAGDYAVEVTLAGFDAVRFEGIRVGVNSSTNLDVRLRLATLAESVQVVAEAPLLDAGASSAITTFNTELVEELPTDRNFYDYIHVAPGMTQMNSGGSGNATIAFGSNVQSNSWNVDGIEASAPETGSSWWSPNVDAIEEVEIIGIGAPAEFGNATGAVFNVVTRKGGDRFSGAANWFHQRDGLTWPAAYASSATGAPAAAGDPGAFAFRRDRYADLTALLGGPLARGRAWFMATGQRSRESSWEAGNDPAEATPDRRENDKLSLKLTARFADRHEVFANGYVERRTSVRGSSPNVSPAAASKNWGDNVAATAGLTSAFSGNTLFEARYAGWWASLVHDSQTASSEIPFIDYDASPTTTYSGGITYPWDYWTWSHQFRAKLTHYAEEFLGAQHEFRFGVQFAAGVAEVAVAAARNGAYLYRSGGVLYQVVQEPYRYGGTSRDHGFFVDDTVTVNDRLTLNLGVRLDLNRGGIPEYERLGRPAGGEASRFVSINAVPVPGTAPGFPDLVRWNLVSPRLGFSFRPDEAGRSAVKGFFGVHYDQNVIGNWNAPAPGVTPLEIRVVNPDGAPGALRYRVTAAELHQPDNLLAPRSFHFTAAYEREVAGAFSAGIQYVHKYADRLVGWSILGGRYETVPWNDPWSGAPLSLLNELEPPTLVKGNTPGDFPGAPDKYEQTYRGLVFSFAARNPGRLNVQGSYTWSRSTGLISRPWSQSQNSPFYGSQVGQDPNAWQHGPQRLQGDRPHMVRLQSVAFLPRDFLVAVNANFESGKPFSRQVRGPADLLSQRPDPIIVEPAGSRAGLRQPFLWVLDLRFGKHFEFGGVGLELDAWLYNALNSTASIWMTSLQLEEPGETFIPSSWVEPRRVMLLAGVSF